MKTKPPTHARANELKDIFGGLSKNALLDLLGDALDAGDPEWTRDDALDLARPRMSIRDDREPKSWRRS